MSDDLQLRKSTNADSNAILNFRNTMFYPTTQERWDLMENTAIIAENSEGIIGAIPLQYRNFKINTDTIIPVAFENAVGVHEKYRSHSIGTKMLNYALISLKSEIDSLYVYRTSERSKGYRFYRKTNHADLFYIRFLTVKKPVGTDNETEIHTIDMVFKYKNDLLKLFNSNYGKYGGYWQRHETFYTKAIHAHVYKNDDWKLFLLKKHNTILAYAIINPACQFLDPYAVYEIAAVDQKALTTVLDKIKFYCAKNNRSLNVVCNPDNPYYTYYIKQGFTVSEETPFIMSHLMNPESVFKKLDTSGHFNKYCFNFITPHRDLTVNKNGSIPITFYLKESMVNRLFFNRIDLEFAVENGLIRMIPNDRGLLKELSRIFRYHPWVTFFIDYV